MKTVADVQRDQDVVEAVPHLFPVKRKSQILLFLKIIKDEDSSFRGGTHNAIDAALSLLPVHHRFDFFVERKNITPAIWQLSFGNTASPNYWQ